MEEVKKMTCIACPQGCALSVKPNGEEFTTIVDVKVNKVKRRKGWSQTAYGWEPDGKDIVIFTKYFRHPSDARKEAKNIDPEAEYLD